MKAETDIGTIDFRRSCDIINTIVDQTEYIFSSRCLLVRRRLAATVVVAAAVVLLPLVCEM
jgi:hypothetical protein